VLGVVAFIAGILRTIPGTLVSVALRIALGPTAEGNLGVTIAESAVNFIGTVLFTAISFIALTLLFVDLRNRHEGADLAERLDQLEAGVPTAA
jgi:hypothetical protein